MTIFQKFGRKTKAGGIALILALPITAQAEGLRLKAHLDPVGIPTICYGETQGVKMGDVKTKEECDTMLSMRLAYFGAQVKRLVKVDMTPAQHAAYSSFTYNVGVGAFQKSSVLRLANEGRKQESCDYLRKYIYAGGRVLAGLVKRREAERALCLQ